MDLFNLSLTPYAGCKAISYYSLQEIYYTPYTCNLFLDPTVLTPSEEDYVRFLFVYSETERYGYPSGVHGLNTIHGSTQVAYLQEFTSCRTDKKLTLGERFIIKPAKLEVTSDNAIYVMITDVLETREPYFETPYQMVIADLIKDYNLTEEGFESLRGTFKNETIDKVIGVFHEDKATTQARIDEYFREMAEFS